MADILEEHGVMNRVEFFKPNINKNTSKYIEDVLNLTDTKKTEQLEQKFKEVIGCKYALSVNSGSSAMHLAMCALDFKRGDKVICSINIFPSTPEAVRHFDAEPIFVDIEDKSYNIDLKKLEIALEKNQSKKLKAIIINHVAGDVVNLEKIYLLANRYNVKVIQDATNSMGRVYKNTLIGSAYADITVFSFSPNLCNGIVNGGMLVTADESIYNRAKMIRFHGMQISKNSNFGNIDYIYDVLDMGWKYDMSQLDGAYCLAELEDLDKNIEARRAIGRKYTECLANTKHVKLPDYLQEHIYSQYIIQIDKNRDHFANELKKEGIEVSVHYMPLHLTEYYKAKYNMKVFDFAVALSVFQKVLSLPIYASMSEDDVKRVCDAVKKVASAHV